MQDIVQSFFMLGFVGVILQFNHVSLPAKCATSLDLEGWSEEFEVSFVV